MSYQSFPWEQGDSVSPAKLIALDLPKLEGKSFLDVGCNAGFFCGFADWQGAKRVVGIDSSEGFLATARELFRAASSFERTGAIWARKSLT